MTPADLAEAVRGALRTAVAEGALAVTEPPAIVLERPGDRARGDYATGVALRLARPAGLPSRAVATAIAGPLRATAGIAAVEVAGPGFLNIRVGRPGALAGEIVAAGAGYGRPATSLVPATDPDLVAAIGLDAARYATARSTGDGLDRWLRRTDDNPLFRLQYAHSRLVAVGRNAAELGIDRGPSYDPARLDGAGEADLIGALGEFPRITAAGRADGVARYLEELVATYEKVPGRVLPQGDEEATPRTVARLWLCEATRVVLANGLGCLGVRAPERL